MSRRSQPQYIIEATAACKTHRPGTRIIYTGPRDSIPKGWRMVERIKE